MFLVNVFLYFLATEASEYGGVPGKIYFLNNWIVGKNVFPILSKFWLKNTLFFRSFTSRPKFRSHSESWKLSVFSVHLFSSSGFLQRKILQRCCECGWACEVGLFQRHHCGRCLLSHWLCWGGEEAVHNDIGHVSSLQTVSAMVLSTKKMGFFWMFSG